MDQSLEVPVPAMDGTEDVDISFLLEKTPTTLEKSSAEKRKPG